MGSHQCHVPAVKIFLCWAQKPGHAKGRCTPPYLRGGGAPGEYMGIPTKVAPLQPARGRGGTAKQAPHFDSWIASPEALLPCFFSRCSRPPGQAFVDSHPAHRKCTTTTTSLPACLPPLRYLPLMAVRPSCLGRRTRSSPRPFPVLSSLVQVP